MRIGLVTCVRDEAEVLLPFLSYHRALGVTRFYVYLDRSRDASHEIVRAFDGGVAIPRDRRADEPHITCLQLACADDALARARVDGLDWLLHLDVDEFAWGESPGATALARGDLLRMLSGVRGDTEAVLLRTLEVVPHADLDDRPFWLLHDVQDGGALERDVYDPGQHTVRTLARWLGHDQGKSVARVAADLQAATPHLWTRRQGVRLPAILPIAYERRGCHYHFVVRGARHWRQKYRKLADDPATWPRGGPVEFPKQAWKEAAARMSADEAERYARRWVLVGEPLVASGRARGIVRRVTDVEEVLRESGFLERRRESA
ncbi:MAG: glycosyltransferase family 2 protein [Actinobacteria bacterium]|nr:glycosyltransferase family 2 protein [Actinomycetota bacterium]